MFPREPQYAGLKLHAVFKGLWNFAARGVQTLHHQYIRKTFREHAKMGARAFDTGVLQPQGVRAADVDAIKDSGNAVEAGVIDQDVECVYAEIAGT